MPKRLYFFVQTDLPDTVRVVAPKVMTADSIA